MVGREIQEILIWVIAAAVLILLAVKIRRKGRKGGSGNNGRCSGCSNNDKGCSWIKERRLHANYKASRFRAKESSEYKKPAAPTGYRLHSITNFLL